MSAYLPCTGLSPSLAGFPKTFPLGLQNQFYGPNPGMPGIPVWPLPRSLAATYGIDLSFFSSGYLDVSVHRVPDVRLWIYRTTTEVCSAGFPHSDISGSLRICRSPKLFAAYHVFLRLLVPRHPPCALSCLTRFTACIALQALVQVLLFSQRVTFSDVFYLLC